MIDDLETWRKLNPNTPYVANKTAWERHREKPTRKTAIDAFCNHCMGWNHNDPERPRGIVADIRACDTTECPLHQFRPYKQESIRRPE